MPRKKNDGLGRFGGRAKGTPNKVTATVKEWLSTLIDKNRRQVERDLKALEPKDRLQILEKLMAYVIPKQQAVAAQIDYNNLSDEQLDMIISELTKGTPDDERGGVNDERRG